MNASSALDQSSLAERVTDALRRAILPRRSGPGARLVEDRLSEELGVSRIPVREALRVLAGEGLVAMQPRRGASVADVSPEVARDLIEVRATLEALNARLAARRHEPSIAGELAQVLEAGNRAARVGSTEDLVALNAAFHDKLAEAGRNTILWDLMRSLRERTGLVFSVNTERRAEQDWDEHARILAAVIAGDEERAAVLAASHVYSAAENGASDERAAG
jgi:DNA-binding GntR family transcriptional regulator